jgi:hypothetical protein
VIPKPTTHRTHASSAAFMSRLCQGLDVEDYAPGDIEAWCQASALTTAYDCWPRPEYAEDPALTPRAAVALEALVTGARRHRSAGEYTAEAWRGALADLEAVGRIGLDGDYAEVLRG